MICLTRASIFSMTSWSLRVEEVEEEEEGEEEGGGALSCMVVYRILIRALIIYMINGVTKAYYT